MRHAQTMLRPGMTAIAAVLALTTTPLLAQSVDPAAPAPSEPMLMTPSTPVTPPAEATPAAPEAALNIPKITVNMDDAPATTEPATSPAETASAPVAPVQRAAPERTERAASTAAPVAAEPAAESAAAPVTPVTTARAVEAPAPEAAVPPPVAVAPTPNAAPMPVTTEAAATDMTDEIVLGAGGILGALALAGGAFAFASRRRRHRDEAVMDTETSFEPLTLDTPVAAPAMTPLHAAPTPVADTAGTALPAGFDLSRFGRHVQAAYRGPTQDNPSLSLSKRLKRARFYDQRERAATMRQEPAIPPQQQAPARQPARQPEFVTSRRIGGGNAGFRPAYQG